MTARILVVDDVEPNVRLLEAKLTLEYYEVLTACDGATALQIASDERPDIILLDVMMPGMDGPAVLAGVRRLPAHRETPVIFMTAQTQDYEIARLEAMGAAGVVIKPFDPLTLGRQVRALLEARPG